MRQNNSFDEPPLPQGGRHARAEAGEVAGVHRAGARALVAEPRGEHMLVSVGLGLGGRDRWYAP